jgi:hypothetical protein
MSPLVLLAVTWLAFPGSDENTSDVLAKAAEAFRQNEAKVHNWTWTTEEHSTMLGPSGVLLKDFPKVKVESLIRSDGSRCEGVISWGDGVAPYPAGADSDTRCQAAEAGLSFDFIPVAGLFKARNARITARTADAITISFSTDKSLERDQDMALRCAAAMQGTIRLDAETMFPQFIRVEIVGSSCRMRLPSGQTAYASPGGSHDFEFTLQKDKLGRGNDFWILSRKLSINQSRGRVDSFVIRGRQIRISAKNPQFRTETKTIAQEFGSESAIRFGEEAVKKP